MFYWPFFKFFICKSGHTPPWVLPAFAVPANRIPLAGGPSLQTKNLEKLHQRNGYLFKAVFLRFCSLNSDVGVATSHFSFSHCSKLYSSKILLRKSGHTPPWVQPAFAVPANRFPLAGGPSLQTKNLEKDHQRSGYLFKEVF
ncbi:MAG: hypothetical protein CL676_06315 [Bdellovibrionaceae bacterium]|nr:hypothetical protein [Pseudobdellovibrionaceae bacterium]